MGCKKMMLQYQELYLCPMTEGRMHHTGGLNDNSSKSIPLE